MHLPWADAHQVFLEAVRCDPGRMYEKWKPGPDFDSVIHRMTATASTHIADTPTHTCMHKCLEKVFVHTCAKHPGKPVVLNLEGESKTQM